MKRTKHIPVNQEEVKTLTLDRTHIERIIDVELMKWNKFQEINRRERRWRRIGHTLRKPVITINRKSYHWNPQGKNIERPKTLGEYSCVSMSSTICSHGQTSASTLLYCSWSCGRLGGRPFLLFLSNIPPCYCRPTLANTNTKLFRGIKQAVKYSSMHTGNQICRYY